LGTSFGRGGATTNQQDLQHADCILIQGSNMAECHPVGFQWVMEAKERGATVIHIDPRFTRTSALADMHVPIRAGSDIAFLGGIIRYILENDRWFHEYVLDYTNAATIVGEGFRDTEDQDGVFSGFDPDTHRYDPSSWMYEGASVAASTGQRERPDAADGAGRPRADRTLKHPRCVFQLLRKHYARYTPELVEQVCGVPAATLLKVAETLCRNSGRERTSAFCYAVGWTQHSVGVQYIRTAAIIQALLGNMGRPGGGILALRGHASIQGSTDIPTLYDMLPGYIPMPRSVAYRDWEDYVSRNRSPTGYWGKMEEYFVSLMKAWYGDAATAESGWAFDHLPRIDPDHSAYVFTKGMFEGRVKGFFLLGENPAVGSSAGKWNRLAMSHLDWLVVRDLVEIESAAFWYRSPEIESGELRTEDIATEVFLLPAAAHTEKDGSFTNTQRLLQWHHTAVEPRGDCRSELWFMYHLGRILRRKLAGSKEPRDQALRDLTWEYTTSGEIEEPSAEEVLAEVSGYGPERRPLNGYAELKRDGSTSCGCWIYSGCFAGGVNQTARRRPVWEQGNWPALEWGWAWPDNRRVLYNRASADPEGKPWSERKRYVWWSEAEQRWQGVDRPDFRAVTPPSYRAPDDAQAEMAISGIDPFVMQADGKAWLYVPRGLADGPMPTHYEPLESPFANALYPEFPSNPARQLVESALTPLSHTPKHPGGDDDVYPYLTTTYRLTEHHTAGGMSRFQEYLAELQPEFFCEVSPELARERGLENAGWATIISPRAAIEARVLVTERVRPLVVQGRVVHTVGLPYHWGAMGLSTGDSANDLFHLGLDPNVHIQEVKAATCDIRPGRRPRGPGLLELVDEYRRRAGLAPGRSAGSSPA
jgi:formate dehydrogenase major subunit